ncbi:MAG: hypothetical protein FJ271_06950 [Planctomycetes bacterium]|nr:hypothetical protein [Planctomycetota bacterium]
MRHLAPIIVLLGLTWEAAGDGLCRPCGRAARWVRAEQRRPRYADLRWRLTPGQVFHQTTEAETRQKMKVFGMAVSQRQKQRTVLRWQFKAWDDEGMAVFRCQIVDLHFEIDIGGKRLTSYLPEDKQPSPLADMITALKNDELQVLVDHDGTVVGVKHTMTEFINWRNAQPQFEPLGKSILGGLHEQARLVFSSTPNRIVRTDEPIQQDSTSPLADTPSLSLRFRDRLAWRNNEKNLHHFALEGASDYSGLVKAPGVKLIRPPPPGKRRGTVSFDAVRHRLSSLAITATFSGTIEIDIGGQMTSVAIEQEQTTRVRITDHRPARESTSAIPQSRPKQ